MAKFHVLYHSPCPDGCFAALAAAMWFEQSGIDPLGKEVRWQPMEVFKSAASQFDVELVTADDEVFLLDYTGDASFVLNLASRCLRCTVLDHHQTALTKLRKALEKVERPTSLKLVLDMHRSGAMIALDYFSSRPFPAAVSKHLAEPAVKRTRLAEVSTEWTSDYGRLFRDESEAKRLLHIFRFVEDADIWHWWMEGSRNFHAGFCSMKLDMNPSSNPSLFENLRSMQFESVMATGAAELAATQRVISKEVERTFELVIKEAGGIRCLGVITERGDLRSSMGHEIAVKSQSLGLRGFGCVIYAVEKIPEGHIKFSVRAVEAENSLEITERFGGGGHKGASSCNVELKALDSWRVPGVPEAAAAAVVSKATPRCTKGFLMDAYRCLCCAPADA